MTGKASDRKQMPCNKNVEQKSSAVATPNREKPKDNNMRVSSSSICKSSVKLGHCDGKTYSVIPSAYHTKMEVSC